MVDGEADKQVMWSRSIGQLLRLAIADTPDSISVALRHVVARLPLIQAAIESHKGGSRGADAEYESYLSVWRNYAVVACAACAASGGSTEHEATSSHAIFQAVLPFLRPSPVLADALILVRPAKFELLSCEINCFFFLIFFSLLRNVGIVVRSVLRISRSVRQIGAL
jgi:hypothetical protein